MHLMKKDKLVVKAQQPFMIWTRKFNNNLNQNKSLNSSNNSKNNQQLNNPTSARVLPNKKLKKKVYLNK